MFFEFFGVNLRSLKQSNICNSLKKGREVSDYEVENALFKKATGYTIKLNKQLTIVDTPGFIDDNAIYNFVEYNKTIKFYPKKEIKVKTFQVRNGYAIVVNDILRIENIGTKPNSFSFYMSDKLRYEKIKTKNEKLTILPNINISIEQPTDILINGLGFIRITKPGNIKIYALDSKLISYRKSMI